MNARGILAEVAAPTAVDVEPLEDDAGGANCHNRPLSRPEEQRATASDEVHAPVDDQVADVRPRSHLNPVALTGGVHAGLER